MRLWARKSRFWSSYSDLLRGPGARKSKIRGPGRDFGVPGARFWGPRGDPENGFRDGIFSRGRENFSRPARRADPGWRRIWRPDLAPSGAGWRRLASAGGRKNFLAEIFARQNFPGGKFFSSGAEFFFGPGKYFWGNFFWGREIFSGRKFFPGRNFFAGRSPRNFFRGPEKFSWLHDSGWKKYPGPGFFFSVGPARKAATTEFFSPILATVPDAKIRSDFQIFFRFPEIEKNGKF